MLKRIARVLVGVVLFNASALLWAGATDLSELPILMANAVSPTMVLAVDDSGSMDTELMQSTNDGAAWWNTTSGKSGFTGWSYTNSGGTLSDSYAPTTTTLNLNFNALGAASTTWLKYAYLFPNIDHKNGVGYSGSVPIDHFNIPPTDAYAYFRSSSYNPLYYNPSVTYSPWTPAYYSGSLHSFGNIDPLAAPSHPTESTGTSWNLTAQYTNGASGYTFHFVKGMVIPGGSIAGIKKGTTAITSDVIVGTTAPYTADFYEITVPYYLATYYVVDPSCTASAPACVAAPNGARLRRYEIKSGNTFPGGRSYADEMQNFANWFSYYRKRRLMLNSSMSSVLPKLSNLRMGAVWYNNNGAAPTVVDLASTAPESNARYLLGQLYTTFNGGGTPARETVRAIANQYMSTTSGLVRYSCQRNATMLITDGFANTSTAAAPATVIPDTLWFKSSPYLLTYTSTSPNTLTDIASYYYKTNIRSDLTPGTVPINPSDTNPAADSNPNPHINTYALTLGAKGTIYGTGSNQALFPYIYAPNYPNPNANRSPTAVDDLWHATINSRGKMMSANNASDTVASINSMIDDILGKAGAGSAGTLSNDNIQLGDNVEYDASFVATTWYGDLVAASLNTATGKKLDAPPLWSLKKTLASRDWSTRLIASNDGAGGVDFSTAGLTAEQRASLNTASLTDHADVINYLRGDRSLEGTYRIRDYVLGDIVDAEPVYVRGANPMVYQAANDGMLHAVNATTGQEAWAYVPSFVVGKLNKLTSPTYSHAFYVDGTPTVALAGSTRLLVGGLRNGGAGYYALDVTSPAASTIADVAAKVKWEFPNAATSTTDANNVGYSYGKPIITPTAYGDVVLVTSGYNNTTLTGDGKGHLFVLNPATGAVIRQLATSAGSAANPSGLAQIAAYNAGTAANPKATLVYGGDLLGNVWKFDLSSATPADWSVSLLATLKDASGVAQPITGTPELSTRNGKPAIYVGTGQLLGASDKTTTQIQSVYMIVDKGVELSGSARLSLVAQTMAVDAGGVRTLSRNAVDLGAKSGWFFDLPAGEKMNVDPLLAAGMLVFNTNAPSADACKSASYIYQVDMNTGGMMTDNYFQADKAWAGKLVGYGITSRPRIALLPSGKWIAINHTSDDSVVVTELSGNANRSLRKVGWREPRF